MDNPIHHYWKRKLADLKDALESNHFEAHVADTIDEARQLVVNTLIPALDPKQVSWGGSMTHVQTGIYEDLKSSDQFEVLDTYDKGLSPEDSVERRRQALLSDVFITGTNAVTEDGVLVNLDMIGNRVAALTFGPRHVVVLAGRNKLVTDVEEAVSRIKGYAAPVNTMRLDKKTPCVKTAVCSDCNSPDRICNTWTITEKSFPKGRVKIVLINADLGF